MVGNEAELYGPTDRYLHGPFYDARKPKHGSLRIVSKDTSTDATGGPGIWRRPDLMAITVQRLKYAATSEVAIHSFEVKRSRNTSVQAVHEALSHRRIAHFSYLVWNWPITRLTEQTAAQIVDDCRLHGIGLIIVHDPNDLTKYYEKVPPRRNELDPEETDEIIERTFATDDKEKILSALSWRTIP